MEEDNDMPPEDDIEQLLQEIPVHLPAVVPVRTVH
jgi:hypothetical protein